MPQAWLERIEDVKESLERSAPIVKGSAAFVDFACLRAFLPPAFLVPARFMKESWRTSCRRSPSACGIELLAKEPDDPE